MASSINHAHPRHDVPDMGPKMVNRLEQSKSPYVSDGLPVDSSDYLCHADKMIGPGTHE